MASETTAAATGAVGVVRRDPMAMLPFCGYNMGEYFGHWLEMGKKIPNPPAIFNVNWFRTDENGKFIWPGYGDNLRVLKWILSRCRGEVGAEETPVGYLPRTEDIDIQGMTNVTADTIRSLLQIDMGTWSDEMKAQKEFLDKFDRLPEEIRKQHEAQTKRLG
jgi:phosphoenolpyruvate carboxykinase (GTP)